MAMVTRCPACNTVFRVAPEQLQSRGGTVRCGRCMTVFDGFKSLSTAPDPASLEPAAPADATPVAAVREPAPELTPAPAPAEDARGEIGVTGRTGAEAAHAREPAGEASFRLEPVSATELAAAASPLPRGEGAEESRDYGPAPEQLTLEDHLFLEETRAAQARGARWWAAGAALMLVALAAQSVFVFRGEIAAHLPGTRPHLASACAAIGCIVNLPQRPQRIAIEASDLQASDPARPGLIQLTATVRNHAGHDVGYPALDLVLTNTRDHTLARRIFQPQDYLEPARDARAGIPANGEVTINLELDTGDLNPSGFRLDLLAAQAQ